MQRLEHDLQPWVVFVIMPLFALANAGITITPQLMASFDHPVSIGVFLGLLVGKPVGIVLMSWLGVKTGLAKLPEGMNWQQVIGIGFLAGIGFTMSIFINSLAFADSPLIHAAKMGILSASLLAALVGLLILRRSKEPLSNEG